MFIISLKMISDNREWTQLRDALVNAITSLGYPAEFWKEIAAWRQKKEADWEVT